jgi:long-chain fatty acid transport protein
MSRPIRILCILLLFRTIAVYGITDEEIFRNFQFSFVNPGARATAMGNAFIALADDATAAEANPAGLTILTKPEVSLEFRNVSFSSHQLSGFSRVTVPGTDPLGPPAVDASINTVNDLQTLNRISFGSFVYPTKKTTFAISMQEAVRLKGTMDETAHFTIFDETTFPPGRFDLEFVATGTTDQRVLNWNFSVAHKIHDDLSVGASLRLSALKWQMNTDSNLLFGNLSLPESATQIDSTDHAFAWNAGVIYRIRPNIFAGAVYKRNARFEVTETEAEPVPFSDKPGPFANVFKIPDTYGFGFAVRPNDNIIVSSDLVRVEYSDLLENIEVGRNIFTSTFRGGEISYDVQDAWEFHAGGEFIVFLKDLPIAIREGYYRKKSDRLQARSAPSATDLQVLRAIFNQGPDENHFTFGAGVVISDLQIDWAVDASASSTNFVLSSVFRF